MHDSISDYNLPGNSDAGAASQIASGASPDSHRCGKMAAAGARRSRGTILIVDDEECVRRLAQRQIEGMGFTAVTVASGSEGVQLFAQQPDRIRCVLLDLMMPGMDGAETLRRLKNIRRNIPVVVVSGYGDPEVLLRLQGLGASGMIGKPYAVAALQAKIDEALGEA